MSPPERPSAAAIAVDDETRGGREPAALARELRRRALALFGRSLHIRTVDTGSCAACESELRLLSAPHYDLHRLGFFFTPAPRHADLLMVTGPAVRAADALLIKAFDATPDPKAVVAVGACALGGVFAADELVHGAVDQVVPVDVYIPGCPPSPLALLQGLLVAVGRLEDRVAALSLERAPAGPGAGASGGAR
jgi:Ni,Fe-hydrogenase III small subunit